MFLTLRRQWVVYYVMFAMNKKSNLLMIYFISQN